MGGGVDDGVCAGPGGGCLLAEGCQGRGRRKHQCQRLSGRRPGQRDAALAEPAPAKPAHMDEESARGATGSVYYFLDLYRYAFMTGNTAELAAMSDDQCKFCQSTINDADDAHKKGGWANKWDQEIVSATYYEKLEGYDYNRIKVVINYGATISCPEAGAQPQSSEPINGQILNFGVRYSGGHWRVGAVDVEAQ